MRLQPQQFKLVPTEGVEPTHPYGYQILSLARLPIPPHRLPRHKIYQAITSGKEKTPVELSTGVLQCVGELETNASLRANLGNFLFTFPNLIAGPGVVERKLEAISSLRGVASTGVELDDFARKGEIRWFLPLLVIHELIFLLVTFGRRICAGGHRFAAVEQGNGNFLREQIRINLLAGVVDDTADEEHGGRVLHFVERAGSEQVGRGGVGGLDIILNVDLADVDDVLSAAGRNVMGVSGATGEKYRAGGDNGNQYFIFHFVFGFEIKFLLS